MPIQTTRIGRVPLWFAPDPTYNKEIGGEFKRADGKKFSSMNRTTFEGSEFQVKLDSDGSFKDTVQQPGDYDEVNQVMVPRSEWILISDLSAAWYAKQKIQDYWKETENPEFLEVHTDHDDKVLYGVQQDGNFYFGGGVPQQIKDFIGSVDPGVHPGFSGTVYYGTNDNPTSNSSRSVSNSISGQYTINIYADGSYIYFFVPSSVDIISALIGGLDMPRTNIGLVNIGGVSYKKYRSTNTYNSGSITIVLS